MEEGSTITVNSGGKLYAYGFITGLGSVTANNGATVYEYFQIPDFRGGTQSTDMQNGVFPLSQYYVQNIEVPLTLHYGAVEKSYTTLYMQSTDVSSSVAFIGPNNSMFNLTSGYVTKRYDSSTDRLVIELNGNMIVSPVNLSLGTGNSINSSEYELPINSNITMTAKSGSNITIGQDLAMLPSSEIIIEYGANCTLSQNVNIYVYDVAQWGNFAGAANRKIIPVVNIAPIDGRKKYVRSAANLVDAKIQIDGYIDASAGCVYTTTGGANIFSTGTGVVNTTAGTETVTYQLVQGTGYTQIPITPAKLKNADGTYLNSANDTYIYTEGLWMCKDHSYDKVITSPTCEAQGYTTYTCTVCGDSYEGDHVDALGHSNETAVTPPTCTKDGYTTYTCTVCGNSEEGNQVPSLGHSYGDWEITDEPTHSKEGTKSRTCSVCGDVETDTVEMLVCDFDGDGIVGSVELTKLRKVLLGKDTFDNATQRLFDMNDDGKINLKDLVKLKKYIANKK